MKKITLVLGALLLLAFGYQAKAQKVVIIGANHTTPDGIAFVATEAISNGEVIYFTEDEYNNTTNVFTSGESVVTFTATTDISIGEVIFLKETASNTLTVTCSSGSCGSAIVSTVNFALGSSGEQIYAYSDGDATPANGVTEIYSVFYSFSGTIPALEDPTPDFPSAVVVDGFASGSPSRTEFNASRDGVSKVTLENPSNYTNGAANADLDITAFTNLNLAGVNPVVTLTSTPTSVVENSGNTITYTFSRTGSTGSPLTVNFNVGGTATFNTDYTESGAASFTTTNGTVTIGAGNSSAAVTITPSGDSDLEPNETVMLTLTSGAGYDAGSPGIATGTIDNDDTANITPLVAVVGTNHTGSDAFSFVALDDISAGTNVYFTENPFDMGGLSFSGAEAVLQWTAPAGGISRGEVVVATETSANMFSTTCNSGTCGTTTIVSGNFSLASDGEGFFAYQDSDTDPSNGITQVDAVLYTGAPGIPGGIIPTAEDPTTKYIGAVLVDGFPSSMPSLTEYDPANRGMDVDQANFQNAANWLHAQPAGTLSTVPFSNIIIATGSANPVASLSVSPADVLEDGATNLVYTFNLDAPATGDITVNFTVGGTAIFNTDYTVTGADTFDATSGSVIILNGTSSAQVTVDPTADMDVEVQETVELMLAAGMGYNGGSPNDATGTITNDDTSDSMPLVAITGLNHTTADGFSFVALKEIPAGTIVYFTDDEYDNTTLLFSSGEAVMQWTSPGATIDKGDVIVATETGPNTFTLTCSDTSGAGCGTLSVIVGDFSTATNGETFYAYEDDDTDPTNGVTDIYAVLYTGNSGTPGGNIPAAQDPSGIFMNALVVDGFPASAPDRTEYDPTKRDVPVSMADFENISNWLHAQTNAVLSTVPFTNLDIVDSEPPVVDCSAINENRNVDTGVCSFTMMGTGFDATAMDNVGVVSLINDFNGTSTLAGETFPVGITPVEWTATDEAGNAASCMINITITDNEAPSVVTQDITVDLDAAGNASITADQVDNGSSDACGIQSLAVSPSNFDCMNIGPNPVMLTVTDINGNMASAGAIVTIQDITPPVIDCPTNIVMVSTSPLVLDPGMAMGTDNCTNPPTIVGVRGDGRDLTMDPYPQGVTTITWTATDASGQMSSCMQTVTINSPPSMANDIVSFSVPGQIGMSAIDAMAKTVDLTVPSGTDVTMLSPTIAVSPDAAINPTSGTPQDFTNPVIYTVTSEDGTPQQWTVTVDIQSLIDLELELGVDNTLPNVGDLVTFTVELTNQGPSTPTSPVEAVVTLGDGYVDVVNITAITNATVIIPGFTPPGPIPPITISSIDPSQPTIVEIQTRVGAIGNYLTLAEVTVANETDVDSTPGNGVDTDGDMNFVDDPGDEDDGDGAEVSPVDLPLSITGFFLVDADTDLDIQPLVNGDVIDITTLPSMNLNIRADATADTESVQLELTGAQTKSMTENVAPYALFGNEGPDYNANVFPLGMFTLEATAYSGNFLGGTSGTPRSINFEFVDGNPLCVGFDISVLDKSDPSSCNAADGTIEVIVVEALSSDLIYSWSHDAGLDAPIATGLEAGTYTITVTDGNGCMATTETTLEDPDLPVVTLAPFPVLEVDSGVYVLTEGSPPGGTYSGPGVSAGMFDPQSTGPGTFEITYTYTDPSTGCTNSAVQNLVVTSGLEDAVLIVLDATTDTELFELTDGLIINKSTIGETPLGVIYNADLNPNGVQFNLTGPITQNRFEGPAPHSLFGDIGVDIQGVPFPVGMYTLVADPISGATLTVNFEVVDENPACVDFLAVILDAQDPFDCISEDGYIDVGVEGFTGPLAFEWSHDNTLNSSSAANLGAGTYTVTVTDDNGCTETLTRTLVDPDPPIVTLDPFIDVFDTDSPFPLTGGSPPGGDYFIDGVMATSFNPMDGAGIYEITYEYTDPASGCSGTAMQTIRVIDTSVLTVTHFVLVNADSNGDILDPIINNSVIDLASLPTNLNIRAETTSDVESVRLELTNGTTQAMTENFAPYALFGDVAGNYNPGALTPGMYTLTATPYSGNNLSGTMGTPLTINFTVTDSSGAKPSVILYPNPASTQVNLGLDTGQDIKGIQLHDGLGRLVRKHVGSDIKIGNQYLINVSQLPEGIYYIRAIDGLGNIIQEPVVIEHK